MTLSSTDVQLLFEIVGSTAVVCGAIGYVGGWLSIQVLELVVGWLRKRGARAPFVERAVAFERRAQRWSTALARIAERNRREAARRG